jgi:hypothetical protein
LQRRQPGPKRAVALSARGTGVNGDNAMPSTGSLNTHKKSKNGVSSMDLEIRTEVDREHSVDPSYIVRYQVFENGRFIGGGVAQHHRLAGHNNYRIPATIKRLDGRLLSPETLAEIKREIDNTAKNYIDRRRQ